jgi:hypothetical protein
MLPCPKCQKGTVIKGNTAYGCSDYKSGCDLNHFDMNQRKIEDQNQLKRWVYNILKTAKKVNHSKFSSNTKLTKQYKLKTRHDSKWIFHLIHNK